MYKSIKSIHIKKERMNNMEKEFTKADLKDGMVIETRERGRAQAKAKRGAREKDVSRHFCRKNQPCD